MHRPLRPYLIAAWVLVGCDVYDSGLIQPSSGGAGSSGMIVDSGARSDASQVDQDGGDDDGGMCSPRGMETCNLRDDDCDGSTDEDTQVGCEGIIVNGSAECVNLRGVARCVLRKCYDGWSNCNGDPADGCEDPYCACHDCPLDDGGSPVTPAPDDDASVVAE